MGELLQLEDFSAALTNLANVAAQHDTKSLEKKSFDSGYRDGWNDAFAEARTQDKKARQDIAGALQELSFTYFEARQHIMGSFRPLLQAMMDGVLPHASKAALIPFVQQEMEALADMVEPPIKIACAPSNVPLLQEIVGKSASLPIDIEAEETLTSTQIQLRYTDGFSSLDTETTVKRIQAAIEQFFTPEQTEEPKHA
ncbi:hypothetical protein N9M66_00645 [Litoreibacter sp.]|nr:hypothetical protein [Litoreibacter sp.]